jgi:hypothetical protein
MGVTSDALVSLYCQELGESNRCQDACDEYDDEQFQQREALL